MHRLIPFAFAVLSTAASGQIRTYENMAARDRKVVDSIAAAIRSEKEKADTLFSKNEYLSARRQYKQFAEVYKKGCLWKPSGGSMRWYACKQLEKDPYCDTAGIGHKLDTCLLLHVRHNTDKFEPLLAAEDSARFAAAKAIEYLKKNQMLRIDGEVLDVEGTTLLVYGTAMPQWCEPYRDCDAEGVNGATMTESNLRIENYQKWTKTGGSAVVGSDVSVRGYIYKSRTSGRNAFGAVVPVRVYRLTDKYDKWAEMHNRSYDCKDKVKMLIGKSGITREEYRELLELAERMQ